MDQQSIQTLFEAKKQYSVLYTFSISNLPYGNQLTYILRPLTLEEFNFYREMFMRLPISVRHKLEDDIYKLGVVDATLPSIDNFPSAFLGEICSKNAREILSDIANDSIRIEDFLPAGVVSSVANAIIFLSSPHSIAQYNNELDAARLRNNSSIIEKMKGVVVSTLGYKREEIDSMTFRQLADAMVVVEDLMMNEITPPFTFISQDSAKQSQTKKPSADFSKLQMDAAQTKATIGNLTEGDRRIYEEHFSQQEEQMKALKKAAKESIYKEAAARMNK